MGIEQLRFSLSEILCGFVPQLFQLLQCTVLGTLEARNLGVCILNDVSLDFIVLRSQHMDSTDGYP
jgi:hypothetical protein